MEVRKKEIIFCHKCGKTRYYFKNRCNYCTQCGNKFNYFEKLFHRIKLFFRHT